MTKLEPTRTSSDLTATERLRRMLDELGVEYEGGERSLRWRDRNGVMMQAFPLADGELGMDVWSCTPEQAIAATLGSSNCSNSERTGAPCLPHFWTHDGVLHIEATRMPTRIVVCEGGTCEFVPKRELDASEAENAKLRELATYALRHIIEFECEEPDLKMFRGKPCEDCADCGSSDCPKCMPRMFDVSGIEVDA